MAILSRVTTEASRASTIRRTCRLRPSVMVISNALSPTRVTRAGRVGPSRSSRPRRRRSSSLVALRDVVLGIRQPLGKLRIVGQNQQAACIEIEPADRKQVALTVRQQIVDRRTPVRIAIGGDVAGRLVQQQVRALFAAQRLAIEGDAVALHVHPRVRIAHDPAVDAHAPRPDPTAGFGTRSEACLGEDAFQRLQRSIAGRRFGDGGFHEAMLNVECRMFNVEC